MENKSNVAKIEKALPQKTVLIAGANDYIIEGRSAEGKQRAALLHVASRRIFAGGGR
jgi:hypothetical protein